MKALHTLHTYAFAVATAITPLVASAAPEITGPVTIEKNQAKNIVAVGGKGEFGKVLGGVGKAGEISLSGVANVNSLVLNDPNAKVGGKILISGNKADGVYAIGGVANVNSVIVGK
jgi:hypothetical protein